MFQRASNFISLLVMFGMLFPNVYGHQQDTISSEVKLDEINITGHWYWFIGPYWGYFDVFQSGNSFTGTLDDVWEGTYGDKIINGIVNGNSISFTRDGKYGIQYWQGDVTDNNGVLEINNGLWRKEGWTSWQTFRASKTNDISGSILVDDNTKGYYNTALGSLLGGSQPQFPPPNTIGPSEPDLYPALEPNLESVAGVLGNWLDRNPFPLNSLWSMIQDIPKYWKPNTDVAIIYPVDAGTTGISSLTGYFGVDNGMYLWIDGVYKFGATQPGGNIGFEYNEIPLGSLDPGKHYFEIILEDHGQLDSFTIRIEKKLALNPTIAIKNIPQFYQGYPSTHDGVYTHEHPGWENDSYAFLTDTMGAKGCNTTSHAMILDYYAQTYNSLFSTDPGKLNKTWISDGVNQEYDSVSYVDWGKIPGYAQRLSVKIPIKLENSWEVDDKKLDAALFSGNPAILWVTTSTGAMHFVVATGKTVVSVNGTQVPTYTINDPIYGVTNLRDHYNGYNDFWSYQPAVNKHKLEQSSLQAVVHSPVHLLVTDPLGRKTGYDPRNGQTWNDIPGAKYDIQTFVDLNGNSLPEEKVFYVPFPINGNYLIQAIGYGTGPYEVDITKSNLIGSLTQIMLNGSAQPSSVDNLNIPYDSFIPLYLPLLKR